MLFSSCHGFVIVCVAIGQKHKTLSRVKCYKSRTEKQHRNTPARGPVPWPDWLLRFSAFGVMSQRINFCSLSTTLNRKTFCRSVDRNFAARHRTSWLGSHHVVAVLRGSQRDRRQMRWARKLISRSFELNWTNYSHLLDFPRSCVRDWMIEIKRVEAFVASVLFCSTKISLTRKPFQKFDQHERSHKGS